MAPSFTGLLLFLFCFIVCNVEMKRNLNQRENLKFMVAEGHTPIECWHHLRRVYGEETVSKPTMRRWHIRFNEGDGLTPVTDLARSGRPREQRTEEKVEAVRRCITNDHWSTLRNAADDANISVTTAHRIVKQDFKLQRKVAKFVPQVLTLDQKRMRVRCCTLNLERLKADPYLLDKVICGDESPVYLHDPENKFESSAWLPAGAPCPTKALRARSQRKMMLTAFFDSCGAVHLEFSEERINTDSYIATLRRLREAIRKKCPGMWKGGVDGQTDREFILQHNNASCHTSNRTLAFLFDQDMLSHPPYSPDLAPCDFWLFPLLKSKLQGVRHRNLQELKLSVRQVIRGIADDEFQTALCKLPMCWRKCIKAEGEYFEGRGVQPDPDPDFDIVEVPDSEEETVDPSDED